MRKEIHFYATKNDMSKGLDTIESLNKIKYVQAGISDSPKLIQYSSYKEISNFGTSKNGTTTNAPSFLIFNSDDKVFIKKLSLKNGKIRYCIYPADNPRALLFKPSGEFKSRKLFSSKKFIIAGHFGPGDAKLEDEISKILYKQFKTHFIKGFSIAKSYRVGPESLKKYKQNFILTHDYRTNPTYYLKI